MSIHCQPLASAGFFLFCFLLQVYRRKRKKQYGEANWSTRAGLTESSTVLDGMSRMLWGDDAACRGEDLPGMEKKRKDNWVEKPWQWIGGLFRSWRKRTSGMFVCFGPCSPVAARNPVIAQLRSKLCCKFAGSAMQKLQNCVGSCLPEFF